MAVGVRKGTRLFPTRQVGTSSRRDVENDKLMRSVTFARSLSFSTVNRAYYGEREGSNRVIMQCEAHMACPIDDVERGVVSLAFLGFGFAFDRRRSF